MKVSAEVVLMGRKEIDEALARANLAVSEESEAMQLVVEEYENEIERLQAIIDKHLYKVTCSDCSHVTYVSKYVMSRQCEECLSQSVEPS